MVSIVVRPELDGRGHKAGGRLQIADRSWSVTLGYRGSSYGTMRHEGIQKPQGWQENRKGRAGAVCLPDYYVRVPQARSIGRRGGAGGHTQP